LRSDDGFILYVPRDITGLIASSEVPQLAAHDECVLSLDVNKENPQEVLTSSTDGTIKLWNITGTDDGTSPFSLLQTYTEKQKRAVNVVRWQPHSSTTFVAGFDGGSVRVYERDPNSNSAESRSAFSPEVLDKSNVLSLAISPDPSFPLLVVGNSHGDIITGDLRKLDTPINTFKQHHASAVLQVEFSPNGKKLATSDATGLIQIWNVAEDHTLVPLTSYTGHKSATRGLNWQSKEDGTGLLASVGQDKQLHLIDVEKLEE